MGEKPIVELARRLEENPEIPRDILQTVYLSAKDDIPGGIREDDIMLHSHETCLKDKRSQAENFRHIEEQSNMMHAQRLLQPLSSLHSPLSTYVVVNPPYPPMTTEELDASFDLPYTRQPHPKYKGKRIPAYDMIKHSVNIHRGCFGGCAFCTISAHQGKFISCRSKESILREVKQVMQMPDFKGYLSDLGGPSANMYGMAGRNKNACEKCRRPSCIQPQICPNLDTNHSKLLDIYHAVDALPGIKRSFIGSGVRYDLLLYRSKDEAANQAAQEYTRELITRHVSGRLKVAPEHTSDRVLHLMRKPSFQQFYEFKRIFDRINREENLREQIIPYFISSHPGCHEEDMAELAVITKNLDFHLEQVQDFTPTPMTNATETWYTDYDPYTLEKVFSAKTPREKLAQRQYFFWYKPEERGLISYRNYTAGCRSPNHTIRTSKMKIIEQSVIPKNPAKKSEDGIVVTNDFIAVIDGSTSKTPYHHCPWMSNGRYAMQLVSRYIRRMPADISCQQFCKGITKAIAHHYWLRFPKQQMAAHPEERLTASAVIYSRLRREVWLVGDCHCLIGDQYYDNPKPYEQQLAEMRAAKVVALLAEGYTESQLRQSYDPAREVMIPTMIEVMKNQNITYAVIDGFPIPQQFVPVITLDFQPWEIVLASDGYPFLAPTLAETEALLEAQRQNDPLNIGKFKATKAFVEGNNSFDDRSYIRFTV